MTSISIFGFRNFNKLFGLHGGPKLMNMRAGSKDEGAVGKD
jgi:hypothetical protein